MKLNLGIIITTKCNRSCPHCLFFCSPNNKNASNLNLNNALRFMQTIPKKVKINEICIYGGEPTLNYKRLKYLIKNLPKAGRIQILTNGYFKDKKDLKKFKSFCKWFNKTNNIIKISNDAFHDIFQDKQQLNKILEEFPNVIWKRREDIREFIKMGRWKKHPSLFVKPPNCTLKIETIIIQQDGKINFCCGGYSSAIGTINDSFKEIINRRHEFIKFLKEKERNITHKTCKKCREYFSRYFKMPLDVRWGP